MASFAISQQPLPWLAAKPSLPPAGPAKRIRIKRETCFSLASCSGPMTSPLQPPAPRFQPPSTFFPFAVDPPFYLNSTILYLNQSRLLKKKMCFCYCAYATHHFSASCNQDTESIGAERSMKHLETDVKAANMTDGCFGIVFQSKFYQRSNPRRANLWLKIAP